MATVSSPGGPMDDEMDAKCKFWEVFPYLKKYWETISNRNSYKEGILDYVTGEWEPEINKLYGDGPNTYNDLLWEELNRLLKEKEYVTTNM